ncbi:hypothetical protein M422DRAFT_274000 [Sphaerobolus stellatus SS14]|uniref:Uncharacterized protein n=1 Tax=Sphaerobolus stellatus (strain SS14) TaxID=990650 RepID=A0A0C9TT90_SPHS4|nr:hypothetical protein M422DRAFT_274000 [Sphaerobolus stellatus SS14]
MSRSEDLEFVQILAAKIHHAMTVSSSYLFAIFPTMLRIASILAGLRFKTRLAEFYNLEGTWIGCLDPRPGNKTWERLIDDEDVLWDIIRKAAISISLRPVKPIKKLFKRVPWLIFDHKLKD